MPTPLATPQPSSGSGLPTGGRFPLFRTEPPYDRLDLAPLSTLAPARFRPGTVLLLQVTAWPVDWDTLREAMRGLLACFPTAPLVLWPASPPAADLGHLAARATGLGARAILLDPATLRETLAHSLTQPLDLGAAVVDWLARRGLRLSPVLAHLARQIVTLAPRHSELSALLREIGESETTTRARFRKKGLPPPRRWHQMARALHTALRIQAEPESGLFRLALSLGYADHSAASQLLRRTLRVRPGAIRGTLGWEWLLDRWLLQAAAPALCD